MTRRRPNPTSMQVAAKTVQRSSCKYKIDFVKSVNLLSQKIEQHNLANSGDSSRKIRVAPAMLAEKLVRLYAKKFVEWQAAQLFSVDVNRLPSLEINNQFLKDIMHVSERTIRNYRSRLKILGFIDREVWHGSAQAYEIWINPEFLFIVENGRGLRVDFKASRQNLPLTSSGTIPEQQERLQELVSGKKREQPENFADTAPEPQMAKTPEPQEPGHENDESNNEGNNVSKISKNPHKPLTNNRLDLLRRHTKAVLMIALSTLFKGRPIPPRQKEAAFRNIALLYADAPPGKFPKITKNYSERLKLAAKIWRRECGPLPDIDQFFDPGNADGFRKTRNWLYTFGGP
jgi:hypothetical protein